MLYSELLSDMTTKSDYRGQIVHVHEVPGIEPCFGELDEPLHRSLSSALVNNGIQRLYSHQAAAINSIRLGNNTLLTSGPASGKSLCYILPILESLLEDPSSCVLMVFPTKALCQDQHNRLQNMLTSAGFSHLVSGVYDGDTDISTRRKLRDYGSIVLTNPDMLHVSILPNHVRWARLFSNLRYIILDELHTYSGILGSNMCNLLRRLERLCSHHGSAPNFIASSATISNPLELAEKLTGQRFTHISTDGSPQGKRTYVFWNPPKVSDSIYKSRRSANAEAKDLMCEFVNRGIRTITFSKSKVASEMIYKYVKDDLSETRPDLADRIISYRAGYLPADRRDSEKRLFNGEVIGVSATRALELGIDVGGLDACIMVGYPGSQVSFIQQSGRVGRNGKDSLVVMVGLDTATNQYIMSNPDYIFDRPVEAAVIEPNHPYMLTGHLRCAAQELSIRDKELPKWGNDAELVMEVLEENHKVRHSMDQWFHTAKEMPQHEVPLRWISDTVAIQDIDLGQVIGWVERMDAIPNTHPEAIYIHQGDTYRVLSLDLERRLAEVKKEAVDYYTQSIGGTDIDHIDYCHKEKALGTGMAYWGEVTTLYGHGGYEKIKFYEMETISRHSYSVPAYFELLTTAFWIVPPEDLMEAVRRVDLDIHSGLRAIAYALRMTLPLFMTCDSLDFSDSISCANAPWNAIFVYERYPLGLGFTDKAYEQLETILPAIRKNLEACSCKDGCPCCVGKPLKTEIERNAERGEGEIPSKLAALAILDGLIGDGADLGNNESTFHLPSAEYRRIQIENAVRRRLEWMREPSSIPHPINTDITVGAPPAEPVAELDKPDIQIRYERRREFERQLRRKTSQSSHRDKNP